MPIFLLGCLTQICRKLGDMCSPETVVNVNLNTDTDNNNNDGDDERQHFKAILYGSFEKRFTEKIEPATPRHQLLRS
jgi:hypothetical protein